MCQRQGMSRRARPAGSSGRLANRVLSAKGSQSSLPRHYIFPETPLGEVIDCLRWIFSEPHRETEAFSFSTTLKLYQRPHGRRVREAIRVGLKRYLSERLARYPAWVAEAFWSDPDRFAEELERNPQWINERVRRVAHDGDLFAA